MPTPRSLADVTLQDVRTRCAALSLGGTNGCLWNEGPPPRRVDLSRLGSEQLAARVERAGFAAWLDAASAAASDPVSRHRAALGGVRGAAGELPDDLKVLEPPTLEGRRFENPREWAQTEWRLVWEEAAERLTWSWEEDLARVLKESTGEVYLVAGREQPDRDPWEKVVIGLVDAPATSREGPTWGAAWSSDTHLESAAAVISLMEHHQLTSNQADRIRPWVLARSHVLMRNGEPEVVLRAPAVVGRWLEQVLFSELCVPLAPAAETDTPEVLETALALWDPRQGGPLREPPAAFQAAREVLSG